MKSAVAVLLAGLVATGLALAPNSHVVHSKRDTEYTTVWAKRDALNDDHEVYVRIALKQQNMDKGMDWILEVAQPGSRKYGQHWTVEKIIDTFAAKKETIDAVTAWLVRSGIPKKTITLSKGRDWLMFDSTVGTLQSLVKADYHVYENGFSGETGIGTDEYSLPADVAPLVDFIKPGTGIETKMSKRSGQYTGAGAVRSTRLTPEPLSPTAEKEVHVHINGITTCDKYITPACIRAMYNIPNGTLANPNNALGLVEGLGDFYAQEDLDAFYKLAAPNIPAGTGPDVEIVNGAPAPTTPEKAGYESSLDFQIAIPIVYPQKTTLFQLTGKTGLFFEFLDVVDGTFCHKDPLRIKGEMCGIFEPPNVVSISYTGQEDVASAEDLLEYTRECNEFLKLGLHGVTVVVSSSNFGVGGMFNNCLGPHHNIFVPSSPSSCPFVTSVGGTTLPKGAKVGDRETATGRFSSTGGFSNIFPRPRWQEKALNKYLLRNNPNYFSYNTTNGIIPNNTDGLYNRGGRGYPDLSAVAEKAVVYMGGKTYVYGGTSMSTPIVAGIINLINEERMRLGKGPLGFVNPALYQGFEDETDDPLFNDIIKGDQRLGDYHDNHAPSACGNKGFSAVEGWDAVTGLGSPRFPQMFKYLVKLGKPD